MVTARMAGTARLRDGGVAAVWDGGVGRVAGAVDVFESYGVVWVGAGGGHWDWDGHWDGGADCGL